MQFQVNIHHNGPNDASKRWFPTTSRLVVDKNVTVETGSSLEV